MSTEPKAARPESTVRRRLARRLRKRRSWRHADGWRRRVLNLLDYHHPWWDWGHAAMILVGQDDGGNWSEPSPPTWYYRLGDGKRMRFTGFPVHPLSTIEVIKDYSTFLDRTDGLNEDGMYEWKAICVDQDGELRLGKQYWGGNFYGLNRWETRLLGKYLRHWRRIDWWGARSWLYLAGLHAAVHQRKPGACQETLSRESNGYDHWHCQLSKRHDGPHRYNAMAWSDGERLMTKVDA